MLKTRLTATILLLVGIGVGYFVYNSQVSPDSTHQLKLGLDLSGGSHLVYSADVSSIKPAEVNDAMATLRDVIERRVNTFGVGEPIVQTEKAGVLADASEQGKYRLIVELPGVTDVKSAEKMIGETPTLEFMTLRSQAELDKYQKVADEYQKTGKLSDPADLQVLADGPYQHTDLTGRYLQKAQLAFDQTTGDPYILLNFNAAGTKLFAQITKDNIGKPVAVFLDRNLGNTTPITEPIVREEITGGTAQITGNFTPTEAKTLVGRLNSGALPVDQLTLLSTQTIGPSLGSKAAEAGVAAGVWGLVLVALFMVIWYRLPGLLAAIALGMYTVFMLALFELIPVTLTAAGIAGFILSIGMAVDANVLIFERTKEELRKGKHVRDAVKEGFERAWLAIRDSNISSIISAIVLFWFGTSLIEGFALTFGLGVIVSMISAIAVTRTFLYAVSPKGEGVGKKWLFSSGLGK